MTKAKTLDRLELTRQKFKKKVSPQVTEGTEQEAARPEHVEGLSKCPNCGEETLRHEGACNICPNCGYSKCG